MLWEHLVVKVQIYNSVNYASLQGHIKVVVYNNIWKLNPFTWKMLQM